MSNHCLYPKIHYENADILVEENVVWEDPNQEEGGAQEEVGIHYTIGGDCTLTETENESFVTANGDNTTQYFSVLDSSTNLSDVTLSNSTIQNVEPNPLGDALDVDINNGQVVVFKIDGSDELYGFQLIHDDEGNLQKYQFKVRPNAEGNLEAVPETLQIVPVDNLMHDEPSEEIQEDMQVLEENQQLDDESNILVKEETRIEHAIQEFEAEETFEETLDSKEGILSNATLQNEDSQELSDIDPREYVENVTSIPEEDSNQLEGHSNQLEEEIFYSNDDMLDENAFQYESVEDDATLENEGSVVQYEYMKKDSLMTENTTPEENGVDNAESENESYETVDDIHITGDTEEPYQNSAIRKSPSYQVFPRKRILKGVIRKVRLQKNDGKSNLYYLVKNEKENVGQIPSNSTIKPNPRSILKCSVAAAEAQKCEEEEEKYDKRFAKSKEAQQARLFHNFIAQTKIIHAPVRQGRLPRKQEIKPINRVDEEIVVQEVVVSSNGFIETSEQGVVKERVPIKPTEYIQLSDSDEDFDPRTPYKRKRKIKRRKPVEITISDSDEAPSDESSGDVVKRPRGRPPKLDEEKGTIKRPRGRPPKYPKSEILEEIIVIKIDHKCLKCPKSFPSEGSLRSHMQYHNFSQASDAKYICEICGDTFKNSFLLNRHINSHQTNNVSCAICKRIFSDMGQLAAHKKTHLKQQLFRNTTLQSDSPKVFRNSNNKCDECRRFFPSIAALNIHQKQHKRPFCGTCQVSFGSRLTFGDHLRKGCVKKSRLTSPKKRISIYKQISRDLSVVKPNKNSGVVTNIKCDSCSMTFVTYTSLFKHKVLKHGLDDPENSVIKEPTRKSLYVKRMAHSGVRPSTGLKNAFTGLQGKLEALRSSQKRT